MQLFRLMGTPDRMIAFDELPQDLIEGLDMHDESRMPRHWKEFIGIREKKINIPPDRDPLTGTIRTFPALIQKAPYTFIIDKEMNRDNERWEQIESYVKRTAPKDFRLMDRLVDMAKPLSPDVHTDPTLEPEEVVVIPLNHVVQSEPTEATVQIVPPALVPDPVKAVPPAIPAKVSDEGPLKISFRPAKDPMRTCDLCEQEKGGREFSTRQSFKNHYKTMHEKEKV